MITIPINDLKPAIAGLSKVISHKASLECLRCVRVDATPEQVSLTGTDLDMFARVVLPEASTTQTVSFLIPFEHLQSVARRIPAHEFLYLHEGKFAWNPGNGRVTENIQAPKLKEFPVEHVFEAEPVSLPESFPRRFLEAMGCSSTDDSRYILNGIQLDVSDTAGHYLVGTDGRHLFSANSFTLPLPESVTIPNHKLLLWRRLADVPWALASQNKEALVRIVAGDWTMTFRPIEGNYPNWKQVVPNPKQHRTTVILPDGHGFTKILNGLPGGDLKDKPVDLAIDGGTVSVRDTLGGPWCFLAGASATGADITIRLNRDYLAKAFDYGLNKIGLIDPMSSMHFSCGGRQMVVMPLRFTETTPAPSGPQPERKTMPAHTNGAATPPPNGATRSTPTDKPAIEAAIEKLEAFKTTVREALTGINELTTLLKQAVRDQKTGEKEIQQVRQTLRSLQGVRI